MRTNLVRCKNDIRCIWLKVDVVDVRKGYYHHSISSSRGVDLVWDTSTRRNGYQGFIVDRGIGWVLNTCYYSVLILRVWTVCYDIYEGKSFFRESSVLRCLVFRCRRKVPKDEVCRHKKFTKKGSLTWKEKKKKKTEPLLH